MLKDVIIVLNPTTKHMSTLFSSFRGQVHNVKPKRDTYQHDPKHRPDWKTRTTRNSREVEKRGCSKKVRCRLNGATAHMQGILAFLAMVWLWRHYASCEGDDEGDDEDEREGEGCAKCQHPLVQFMHQMRVHSEFGEVYTATCNEKYADIVRMSGQYKQGWHNDFASQYIYTVKEARYMSFQALLAFLRNPTDLKGYTEDEMAEIVDGFVSLCALPDSKFGRWFEAYDDTNDDAVYDSLVDKLETTVEEMWEGKSHDMPIDTYNSGGGGMGRDWYYNILECYFENSR